MRSLIILVILIKLGLARDVIKVGATMSDESLLNLKLENNNIQYVVVKATADSSDTPWDNPFDDNPENDNDTCSNPEGCDGGGPAELKESCTIDLASDSKTEVYMLAFGFIQGLYSTEYYPTETGCERCRDFALPVANF